MGESGRSFRWLQVWPIAEEFQVEMFAIFAAQRHRSDFADERAFFFVRRFFANSPQFRDELIHLQVIENRIAPGSM